MNEIKMAALKQWCLTLMDTQNRNAHHTTLTGNKWKAQKEQTNQSSETENQWIESENTSKCHSEKRERFLLLLLMGATSPNIRHKHPKHTQVYSLWLRRQADARRRSESHSTHVLVSKPEPTIHWWIISSHNGTLVVLVVGWTEYKTRDLVIMKHYLLIPLFTSVKCWENKMLGKILRVNLKGKYFIVVGYVEGFVRQVAFAIEEVAEAGDQVVWEREGMRKG